MLGGLFTGAVASAVLLKPRGCVVPVEAMLDPFLGAVLGIWYAYALVEASTKDFRLPYELHAFVDTVFGCLLGYHLGAGVLTGIEHYFGAPSSGSSLILVLTFVTSIGALFFWSTSRWIKRMEHDDPRIFINGKPYDRHIHSHGSPGPE